MRGEKDGSVRTEAETSSKNHIKHEYTANTTNPKKAT